LNDLAGHFRLQLFETSMNPIW